MPPGIAIIERDGARVACSRPAKQASLAIDPAHVRGKHQAKPQQASRRRVVRIGLDGPFEGVDRGLIVRLRHAPDMSLGARHKLPGAEIVRRARQGANALRGQQLRFDRRRDAAGDLVLHGEDIAELAVVAFGPVMAAGRRVDRAAR